MANYVKNNVKLVSYCKTKMETLGEVTVPLVYKGKEYKFQFHVVNREDVPAIFSLRSLAVLGGLGRGPGGRGEIRPTQKCVFEFCPLAACLFTQALNDNCNEIDEEHCLCVSFRPRRFFQ